MPFLTQPSQFILAWDRHQICWLAYLVVWLYLKNTARLLFIELLIELEPKQSYNVRISYWQQKHTTAAAHFTRSHATVAVFVTM